ncbi:HMG box domain-containing protein [Caenorhabditis elegans]|uniref:HMG box domain-containing protein n=1 Tax=Caenorhabditis elegans TaxID=6239 RepID=Q9XTS5_CAEEL|nr:HMG box domain-containing protein [Caenorhabditis elegans]CAB16309.2 HMG box domain-containing protein [Caenorhabditis elegans]|eukprot:NP_493451.2 HMG [Caenorhabditis elegans]
MSINVDEFQCYRIPNVYVQWYDLEPTIHWLTGGNSNSRQIQEMDQKKKKIRSTSAYALFFRERQSLEKRAAPYATFGQISQKIARQWDSLTEEEKKAYKQRCEKNRKTSIANAVEEKARQLLTASKFQ